MKLKVSLTSTQTGRAPDRIQITTDATATVGAVAEALASSDRRHGQYQTDRALTLAPMGRSGPQTAIPADQTLLDSGIRSGSEVSLVYADDAARSSQRAAAVLRVLSGPDRGAEFPLPLGTNLIGRSSRCDVRLRDPMVSKVHAKLFVGSGRVDLVDQASANGVSVGGVRVTRVTVAVGDVVELGETTVSVVGLSAPDPNAVSTDVAFVRPPRVLVRPDDDTVQMPDAPRPRPPSPFPWLMLIAPLLLGGLVFARLSQSSSGGSAWLTLGIVAMTPMLMLAGFVEQRRQRAHQLRQEIEEFEAALDTCRERLWYGHRDELEHRLRLHPSMTECAEAVDRHADLVWCRRPEHPEFLTVRLGLGDVEPSLRAVLPRAGGIAEFRERAAALAKEYERIAGAPIVGDLRRVGGLGIAGSTERRQPLARATVAQVAALHSPAEVVLACLASPSSHRTWAWLEWLPHTSSPHSPLPVHLAADPGSGSVLLNALEELIAARAGGKAPRPRGPLVDHEKLDDPTIPSVVVVVDDTTVDVPRLVRVAETGPDVGVYVVWTASSPAGIPACCRSFAHVTGQRTTVGMVRDETVTDGVAEEQVTEDRLFGLARRLAPMIDAGRPVDDVSDLPQAVSVVSLLGAEACDDADVVLARWRENRSLVDRTPHARPEPRESGDLRALVGHAGSEPLALDLRTHGPHALVGGTTGAGKSEFLQAWVLGLAHSYSPDRVTFLFVDYKGGSAFADCVRLPHCVGMVTDLSPYLVRRALRSLRAELHFRERLLNRKGKKDLIELEKTGDPECPPSLVIVVDEFAALVSEVPEFVDGVVDVAQRGRSLGLHLVLATQRPAGVIKDNLRANTNLRIALRMADEADSLDVLGTKAAAHFPSSTPGRGAAKSGPGRITPFQSAFPGARTSGEPSAPAITVGDLDFASGRPWALAERPAATSMVPSDIERVVATVRAACELASVPAPRKPWLDALAPIYSLTRLSPRRDTSVPLGVVDVPDQQAQVIEHFRPDSDGNLLVVGAGGSGKSTALRTLAAASSITPGGGVVHVYGLDLAGGALSSLEALPNVGSVVAGDDEERTRRLVARLLEIVELRGPQFAAVAAATLDDYRRIAGRPDEPRVLLVLDGFSTFRSTYEATPVYQQLQRVLLDGRAVGVHVAMTADRPAAVPPSVLSAFQRRVVLRQADEESYLTLAVPRDVLDATSPPGRAIWTETGQEMQLAVLIADEHAQAGVASSAAQASAIEQLARQIGNRHVRPPRINALPSLVAPSLLPDTVAGRPTLGIGDETLEPVGFDPAGVLMVAGPSGSGRTNAVHWMTESIRRRWPSIELVRASPRRSPLSDLGLWKVSADRETAVRELLDSLAELDAALALGADDGTPPVCLVVENLPDFVGTPLEQPMLKRIQTLRRAGCPVIAEAETPNWTSAWPLTLEIRNARTGLLLQPDQSDGENLLRTSLPRIKRADYPPGRGFWIKGGTATKVQLPLLD